MQVGIERSVQFLWLGHALPRSRNDNDERVRGFPLRRARFLHKDCSRLDNQTGNKSNHHKENTMKRRLQRLWLALVTLVLFAPSLALAAGGKAAPVVIVADTRKLDGVMAWWANLYNESHLQFMILTIIIIPLTGVIFGVLADIIMGWIGIDLKSRELAEH